MNRTSWTDPRTQLLGDQFPLPLSAAFTRAQAVEAGLRDHQLAALVDEGLVRRVLFGVYAAAQAPDSVAFRAQALSLVVPEYGVVTDRTAGWLHGVPTLRRGSHRTAPQLDVCDTRDTRMRRPGVDGRRRALSPDDVTVIGGIRVTTLLRTGCDLGRLLWRFDALAAIDGVLRAGVDPDELFAEIGRFRGFRGVRQLRVVAALGDPRSESPGESALRLHWYDAGLPKPDLQHEVLDGSGRVRCRLDVPAPEVRYAAEYDGEEFHTAEADRAHDRERRTWLREEAHWTVDVFTKDDVYGTRTSITARLREGFQTARRSVSVWRP